MAVELSPEVFATRDISQVYHECRPRYTHEGLPQKILKFLSVTFKPPYENAADVGCGTGISTKVMAPHFKHVLGLDYSATQIAEAQSSIKEPNLSFSVGQAENLHMIPDKSLQLLTVGTAIHYFDCKLFFKEVDRVLLPGGCFAQFGYNSYYHEPRNLAFNPEHPFNPEVLRKLNDVVVEAFETILQQDRYKPALAREDFGVEPPYKETESTSRHEMEMSYPSNIISVVGYLKSLGLWQNYCKENNVESEKLAQQFIEKLRNIMKEVTDKPDEYPLELCTAMYVILSRKPLA